MLTSAVQAQILGQNHAFDLWDIQACADVGKESTQIILSTNRPHRVHRFPGALDDGFDDVHTIKQMSEILGRVDAGAPDTPLSL